MKKLIKIAVLAIFTLIVGFGACALYLDKKATELETTAVPFIKKVVPEISTWKMDVFKRYVTQESNDNTSDEDLAKLLKVFSKLGSLKSIDEISFIKINNFVYLTYRIEASYENGPATINLILKETNGNFEISHCNIESWVIFE